MVTVKLYRNKIVFQCEYCGFSYEDLQTSESCEEFCGVHGSCSVKISSKAVYVPPIHIIPIANK
ncbi:MAG TPA: hypothetical protein VK503_06755 [Candidatus Bathyarchaeia archaeon]|nr:hypothetical protein [Candidatus Bathyarchaeia archaeon]